MNTIEQIKKATSLSELRGLMKKCETGEEFSEITEREILLNSQELRSALSDLIEQIESLEDITLTKNIEPYKAEANWNNAMEKAHSILERTLGI